MSGLPILDRRAGRRGVAALALLWAVVWFLLMARHTGMSWSYFAEGQAALRDGDSARGGLHVYAAAPQLQFGPVALVAAMAVAPLSAHHGMFAAQALGAAAAVAILRTVRTIAREHRGVEDQRRIDVTLVVAGACFVPAWMWLSVHSVHIDDVLALVLVVLSVRAVQLQRPLLTGTLLALSADSKPWALAFGCVLLQLRSPRGRVEAAAVYAAGLALAWLPFVLADPHTSNLLHFTIANRVGSGLRALGFLDARTPSWDRAAQLALGLGLGAMAIRRGRWPAVVLVVLCARLLLDPGTNRYYLVGPCVGALLLDVVSRTSRLPVWTLLMTAGLFGTAGLPFHPPVHGGVLLVCCLVAIALLALAPVVPEPAAPGS